MKLLIDRSADEKIRAYTRLCPDEISGMGRIVQDGDDFIVKDVAIFRQKVSAAHSTIEPEALAEFITERSKKKESVKEWCLWWHSHAEMNVFFSGTDTSTIDASTEFPYLVSLVVNKKGESEARVDIYKPVRLWAKLPVEIISEDNKEIETLCQKEINKKVTLPERVKVGYTEDKHTPSLYSGYDDWEPKPKVTADDRYMIQEYYTHRSWLIKKIKKARKKSRKAEESQLAGELAAWTEYGRGLGLSGMTQTEVEALMG